MKIYLPNIFFVGALIMACCAAGPDCPENINLIPMYGRLKKCDEQLKIDQDFLNTCDKSFENRDKASKYYIDKGWQYFYDQELDMAMKRFNQAWLLDSTNADIYWGFGNILGQQQKFKESLLYFDMSLGINAGNAKVWQCAATSYAQLFFQTEDSELLNKATDYLKKSIAIDAKNAEAYAQLTFCYVYSAQRDSAQKYLQIAERIDPRSIAPEIRELLNEDR
ncbi:tetratricopeptide repeat protein [Sphingobacterium sp. LRF_L2]|uniref:tetratricopeptide repeat protein n=1 Tax=Sphingobacterium sp. LRF_L2 TaxID=3369421 RepID=UPI003F63E1AE